MTEMLAAALAKIIFNKDKKNYTEAELEIESSAKTITGLDLKLISIFSPEDLLKLMKSSDLFAGKCIVSAELLNEYAFVKEMKNETDTSNTLYVKSLMLYLEAVLSGELPDNSVYFPKMNFIISKLKDIELSETIRFSLLEYFSMSGQYSKFEDTVFEMIDNGNSEALDRAVKFFESLKNKSDDELLKGNLTRDEVEESLGEILILKKNN